MNSAILAVGTELTSGQILNRNAAWISEKLKAAGLLTTIHLTVPDNRLLIHESLKFCAEYADLLFVTGGLGPTSDDFTRELIAQWSGLALEFDAKSWQHIVDRLSARGYPVNEIQKQQCFFPKGSRILKNSQGTANAFQLNYLDKRIYVLPGPPKEIESVWQDFIAEDIVALTRNLDRHHTCSWDTMGFGESQIAERTEKIAGTSGFEIGYRVHLPYVEVKFSYKESETKTAQRYIEQIDQALRDCSISKNGADILDSLISQLANMNRVEIYDSASGGFLAKRLLPEIQDLKSWSMNSEPAPTSATANFISPKNLILSIENASEGGVKARLVTAGHSCEVIFTSQLNAVMSERKLQIFTERTLIFWNQELSKILALS